METWKPRDRGMGPPQVRWCEKVTRSLNDAVSRPDVQIVDDSLLDEVGDSGLFSYSR